MLASETQSDGDEFGAVENRVQRVAQSRMIDDEGREVVEAAWRRRGAWDGAILRAGFAHERVNPIVHFEIDDQVDACGGAGIGYAMGQVDVYVIGVAFFKQQALAAT